MRKPLTQLLLAFLLVVPAAMAEPQVEGLYKVESPPKVCPGLTSWVIKPNLDGTVSADGKSYKGAGSFNGANKFDFQTATVGVRSFNLKGTFSGKVFSGTVTVQTPEGEKSGPIRLRASK